MADIEMRVGEGSSGSEEGQEQSLDIQLCVAVKNKPILWNLSCKDYKNLPIKENIWKEIARQLGSNSGMFNNYFFNKKLLLIIVILIADCNLCV